MLLAHFCWCHHKIPLIYLFLDKIINFFALHVWQKIWSISMSFWEIKCFKSFTTSNVAGFIPSFFPGGNLSLQTSLRQNDMICEAKALYKQDPSPFTFISLKHSSSKKIQCNWKFYFLDWMRHLLWYSELHPHLPQDNNGRWWSWLNSWSFDHLYIS